MEEIQILEIIPLLTNGGVENMVLIWIQKIKSDKNNNATFDIVTTKLVDKKKADEFKKLGCSILEIPFRQRNVIKRYFALKDILAKKDYHAVHLHTNCAIDFSFLLAAKISGISIRIAHSHGSAVGTNKKLPALIHYIIRPLFNRLTTKCLACSRDSGEHLFGKKTYDLFKNSIDIEVFRFRESERLKVRADYKIDPDVMVVGHAGNFVYEKNHFKILEVFREILNINSKSILLLIGSGPLENHILSQIQRLGIEEHVIMTGNIYGIQQYYSAMDVFIFPSFHEGFSVALIEAQCNGLPCYISKELSEEMIITDKVTCLALKSPSNVWAGEIECSRGTSTLDRGKYADIIKDAGYDSNKNYEKLLKYYRGI